MSSKINKKIFSFVIVLILVIFVGFYMQKNQIIHYKTPQESDIFVRFDMEGYDLIFQNYWKKMTDAELSYLFQLSVQKALGAPDLPALATTTRSGTAEMLATVFRNATTTESRRKIAENVLIIATYNLFPNGRSGLLSSTEETALRQNVANVNPSNNLYKNLGLPDNASIEDVQIAYQKQKSLLSASSSKEAKIKLDEITYARKVLTDENSRTLYNQSKIEPTVFGHIINKTLYVYLDKISPTTLREFALAVDSASTTPANSMIIDLRGNVGGSLDFAQYFIGLFIGPNQYAFDLFHQGNYDPQRTTAGKFDELSKYKQIAILTDGMTQSTAEIISATMKRFHLATVVGGHTRGWGTVENTFPISTVIDPDQKFSLLLVHSLTLRDDNQPIEQNTVLPDIDISQKNWQNKLSDYFSFDVLQAVIKTINTSPIK